MTAVDETEKDAKSGGSEARRQREAKLAEALRANLRRRKAPGKPAGAPTVPARPQKSEKT
ncbi:MAG: hypothetical protein JSR45_16960 [Proteobacteria bacterium]|nr:hypothetical protein [Pseudomonadota bacterium]